jgi:hypothetical protein
MLPLGVILKGRMLIAYVHSYSALSSFGPFLVKMKAYHEIMHASLGR